MNSFTTILISGILLLLIVSPFSVLSILMLLAVVSLGVLLISTVLSIAISSLATQPPHGNEFARYADSSFAAPPRIE
jgi:hypothetical protein